MPSKQRPSLEPRTTQMQVLFACGPAGGVREFDGAWFEARRPAVRELASWVVRGSRLTMRGSEFAKTRGERATGGADARSEFPRPERGHTTGPRLPAKSGL